MGILVGKPFVCILGRDSAYLEKMNCSRDWSYHDYRNVNIQNYISASNELTQRGYTIIRMGTEVSDIMRTNNEKIIEYAFSGYRTELLDIYLPSEAAFFISCGSGLDSVAQVFRRPVVYVNYSAFEYLVSWSSEAITIFKYYWLKTEKRFMTFREILESGAGRFLHLEDYERREIELVENSPEEILEAAVEMDDRLKGEWRTSEEDEDLQRRFWKLFSGSKINRVIRSRIGTGYLRRNRNLLK
jgi:putative glycosyltransferase (TIGR04372 family)